MVVPRVGAWIETIYEAKDKTLRYGRTPCGCVD